MLTDTDLSPSLELNTRSSFVERVRRRAESLPGLSSLRRASSGLLCKDYSHILCDTDFESRWDDDLDYAARCRDSREELFELIRTTVRSCERIPEKQMTEFERDWFTCAWSLVVDVEEAKWTHRIACGLEIDRIIPLAMKLPSLAFTEEVVVDRLRRITTFLVTGCPAHPPTRP